MKVKGIAKLLSAVMAMTCISFPAVSHAENTASTEATPSLKEEMFVNGNESAYINTFAYGIGYAGEYIDYNNYTGSTFAGGEWSAEINDNTLDASALVARPDGWNGAGIMANPSTGADNMIEQASGWGYRGFILPSEIDNNPHDAGVIDARSYADNGAISYDINVEGENIDDVYLTVGYYSSLYDLGWYWEGDMEKTFSYTSSYLDAEKLDAMNAPNGKEATWRRGTRNYRIIRFAGVPLKDYYDAEKGGFQRITVPFSAFTNNSSFNKYAGKSTDAQYIISSADHNKTFNPAMIRTVGIARKDSGTKAVNFTSKIKDVAIVAVSAPANFTATPDASGKVQLSWDAVNNDVTYRIKKTVDGAVTYIDVPEGDVDYYDEDVNTTDTNTEVKYAVIAINAAYNESASTDEVVFNKTVVTNALKQRLFINGNWGDYINTYAYAIGSDNAYLDYNNTTGSTFADEVWTTYINDNTLTEDQLVKRADGTAGAGIIGNPSTGADNMIEPSTGWGYRGFIASWDPQKTGNIFPAQVIDARDYAATGNISYTINVAGQNLDGVYLTVGYYKNLWDLGWYWAGDMYDKFSYHSTYLDAEKLDEIKAPNGTEATWRTGNGSYRAISFAGVPLKDYYDTEKGGFQTITIPFSEFINNSSFNKYATKVSDHNYSCLSSEDHANTFNPALIRTAGIARMDSKSGATFTSQITDISIVAPAAVRDFAGEYNAETGAVKLTWKKSTDNNITKVQLKKTVRGKTEYIDLPLDQISYTETLDTKAEVKYSVIVTEGTYGAIGATEEYVVNKREATTALKKRMVNANGAAWSEQLEAVNGHAGQPLNQYWDYYSETTSSNKILTTSINDNTLTKDQLDANGNNPQSEIAKYMIEPKSGWGFKGMRIDGYNESNNPLPCGVIDLKDYADGYAVFDVRVDQGSLDGVYAAIGYCNSLVDINNFYSDYHDVWTKKDLRDTALLDATYGTDKWKKYDSVVKMRIAGVPLKDYYDTEKGGFQTIKIPLSKFTTSPTFRGTYNKGGITTLADDEAYKNNMNLNLGLVKAMGIVRQDTDPNTVSTFTFSAKDYAFVAPKAASDLVAEKTASGVRISWVETTDTDAAQVLVKEINRQKQYIDVTGSEYLDTSIGADEEAIYYVITKDTAYGTEAVSERLYYNAPETQSEIVSDMQVGKENEVGTGKDSAGNLTDTVSSHWYTGKTVTIWGEYEDYWGAQVKGSGADRRADYWLVDSDYVYDDSVEATNKNKGKILDNAQFIDHEGKDHGLVSHEYGLGGYEYNENLGTIKDISAHKDGYLVMDVSFSEPNGKAVNLDGSYFTVEFAKSGEEIQNHVNGKPNYGKGRVYSSIVRGVPVKDYYDTTIGGYQRVAIPLSAFTNAAEPAMKYVKTREGNFASLLAADNTNNYDFANYMNMFKGAGVARKNFKNASGIAYSIKNMYIVDTAAPRELSAAYTSSGVTLTWKDAAVENVSRYAIYRDGRRLTVVDGVSYTDTTAKGGDHTYEVKTVSPTFDNVFSSAATAQITVPTTSSIAIYAGTGADREETRYTKAGAMEADLMAAATGTRGYAALYDADGVLKSVKTVALGSDTAQTISFANVLATDTLKAFIWNSDMTPECDEKTATPKGTTVLVIGDEIAAQAVDYLDEIGAAAGKALNVTSVYANGATMNNHYTNIAKNDVVYAKSVNGIASADLVSLNDVLAEGDWDYVILQDNSIYDGVAEYYASGTGAAYTEIPVIVAKIREASPAAKIYASQPTGFDNTFYEAQSDNFKAYIDNVVGNEDFFNASQYITSLSAGGIVPSVNSTKDIIGASYIDSHDQMTSTYGGSAVFVNGKNLTEDGKFFTAAYIYRVLANGANVTNAFVPSGVTDAEGILATING